MTPPECRSCLFGLLSGGFFLLMGGMTLRADVFSNLPAASGYSVAYELDIPVAGAFQGTTPVPYSVDNSATVAPGGFDRIAYYLELTNASGTSWVYASMDAFTSSVTQTGLPHALNNPVTFQQSVSNLEVASNVNSVQTGNFDRGQIEMWHQNYSVADPNAVFASSSTTFDWGDTAGTTASGYGSFQVHNPGAKQVVFAYNRWALNDSTNDDVGIGNSTGTHPDWTLAANTASYTSRKLVVLVRPRQFTVSFTAMPVNQQVTPRTVATNLAAVPVSGTVTTAGYNKAVLRILRDGAAYGTDLEQTLAYSGGSASFSFNPTIAAELHSYTFEVYLKQGSTLALVRRVSDVTAGDVYLWYGQSNGQSDTYSGSSNAYLSPWVRTFGMGSDSATVTQAYNFWVQANGDVSTGFPCGIGQWPLVVGRRIVDTYGIPVAILNGSRNGYNITQLQRDDANPDNLADTGTTTYRVYDRLRYRAIQAKVAGRVRGIFFYQGESDNNNAAQHVDGFASLMADWQVDYPSLERVFVSQVHVGCSNNLVARDQPTLRDMQRTFADVYSQVRVMSTNGLTAHTDNCHFAFTGGYETHGLNLFRQVQRELYGAVDTPAIDAPNPASVEIISGNRVRINLRKANSGITVDSASLVDFRLNGSSAVLTSAAVTPTAIELQYDRSLTGATSLDYLAHSGNAAGWVRNSNGVGLLAFSETIRQMQVTLVSPSSVGVSPPGTQLPLQASATTPSGSITRMDIVIDGILHTSTPAVSTIQATWTVPASGTHQIVFRATNSDGQTAEASVVVLTQPYTSPGGVSSGLSVWLKPESGITRDANGATSAWLDSSGNNNSCIQATAAAMPTYRPNVFGVMPGLSFDGGDWLTGGTGMSTASYTKVVRARLSSLTASNNILSSGSASSTTRHALYLASTALPRMWHKGDFVTSGTAMAAETDYTLAATYNSTTKAGILYLNGGQVGTGTATANTTDASYQLGNLSSGAFNMVGSVGEVLIYNRVLSATEINSVVGYLNAKSLAPANTPLTDYPAWSVPPNIPAGKDASPTADANGNGIANLIEFALGLDPAATGTPQTLLLQASGGNVEISYFRPTNRTGVTYQLLESFDLQQWNPVTDMTDTVSAGVEKRRCTRTMAPQQKAFYKLKVAMP